MLDYLPRLKKLEAERRDITILQIVALAFMYTIIIYLGVNL